MPERSIITFGARPGTHHDCSAAFRDAQEWAAAHVQAVPGVSDPRGTAVIRIPPGTWRVTEGEALMAADIPAGKACGLAFAGAGSALSRVLFEPAEAGSRLCVNRRWLRPSFTGLEFISLDASADFMRAEEQGGKTNIQDARFHDVTWTGAGWGDLFRLTGGNNNSEWHFDACSVTAPLGGSWVYVPPEQSSDQFLNFWFTGCRFWPRSGAWLTMHRGGAVRIAQSDVSGWAPDVPTYLFNLLGSSHAQGVCTFHALGLRIEHKSDAALLMRSQWPQGAVTFEQLEQSSQASDRDPDSVLAEFELGNSPGPLVAFRDSQLAGRHRYHIGSEAWRWRSRAAYTDSSLLHHDCFDDFALTVAEANSGGLPVIVGERLRCLNDAKVSGYHVALDAVKNWYRACGGEPQRHTLNLVGANSDAPTGGASLTVALPRHAIITGVRLVKKAGGAGGAYRYVLELGNARVSEGAFEPLLDKLGDAVCFAGVNAAAASVQAFDCATPTGSGDAHRFIRLRDAEPRAQPFTGYALLVDYLG